MSFALVASATPDSVTRVADVRGVVGAPVVASGAVGPAPVVVGLESPPATRGGRPRALRTRFGVIPEAPLSALAPGAVAVSNPIILQARPDGEEPATIPDSALRQMAGTHEVGQIGRIGVYWETYGIAPTDSIEVAVWIERYSRQSIVRRFGAALNLATDLNTPVAYTWREPTPGRAVHVIDGPVPIVSRSIAVDVSNLSPGEYYLDVAVRKIGGAEPARGRTRIVVR
jgi:hypothetical protein